MFCSYFATITLLKNLLCGATLYLYLIITIINNNIPGLLANFYVKAPIDSKFFHPSKFPLKACRGLALIPVKYPRSMSKPYNLQGARDDMRHI